MLQQLLLFTGCSSIQFLNPPLFLEHSQLGHLWSPYNSLCSTCAIYGRPCPAIGHQVLLTQTLLWKAQDFPSGGKYTKNVPTCLDYLQPV